MLFSIVVPVYNSEKTLRELYDRVSAVFEKKDNQDFELVLIDDFSKDNSFSVMESLHEEDHRVKIIQLARNCGQHNALLCGFAHTEGDFIVTIDDDLQHPPEEIQTLIDHILKNDELDAVIGKYASKKHSLFRNFGSKLLNYIKIKTKQKRKDLELTSFRIIRANTVKDMLASHISTPRIGYLLMKATSRIANVTVKHDPRKFGKSQYSLKKLVRDFFNEIFTNTTYPLAVVRNIGIFCSGLSILLFIYYLIRYFFFNIPVVGWTTLVLLTIFFSGLQLFAIGIVGEYLIRILNEAKKEPNYYIRRKKL